MAWQAPVPTWRPRELADRICQVPGVVAEPHGKTPSGTVEAGFSGIETLPIEHDFFRFYRLLL